MTVKRNALALELILALAACIVAGSAAARDPSIQDRSSLRHPQA